MVGGLAGTDSPPLQYQFRAATLWVMGERQYKWPSCRVWLGWLLGPRVLFCSGDSVRGMMKLRQHNDRRQGMCSSVNEAGPRALLSAPGNGVSDAMKLRQHMVTAGRACAGASVRQVQLATQEGRIAVGLWG
ncbi:hypothetical protein E2C01_096325 [Portunus trituberculatus]|uniref:Uncharacterized protein n=1 Tax=Portunus trituberculatus TaxID=210409 RepID=A0A5B7K7Y3_PORTR|nr:hypothetical protein [Portunus trituberculatus]